MKLTDKEKFELKLKSKYSEEYKLVSEYNGYENNVIIFHEHCGNFFEIIPHNILRGNNKNGYCPFCQITTKNTTKEQLEYKLKMKIGEEYSLIEFKGYQKGFTLKHNNCGKEFVTNGYRFFKKGNRCPNCSHRSFAYTTEDYSKLIKEKNPEYTLISDYKNEKTKIKLFHSKCGKEWETLPRNFLYNGCRCPYCKENISKKVNYIENYLIDKNIKYIKEKKFIDCKNKRCLPFDFYISDKNLLIEYDGEQHFFPRREFGSDEKLEKIKINDNIKNSYCIENGIYLLRIHYKLNDCEIYNILEEIFNNKYLSSTTIEKYSLYYSTDSNFNYYTNINKSYKL